MRSNVMEVPIDEANITDRERQLTWHTLQSTVPQAEFNMVSEFIGRSES
jgi:hypothetical protein